MKSRSSSSVRRTIVLTALQLLWGVVSGLALGLLQTLPSVILEVVDREFAIVSLLFFSSAATIAGLLVGVACGIATSLARSITARGLNQRARRLAVSSASFVSTAVTGLTLVHAFLTIDTLWYSLFCAAGMFAITWFVLGRIPEDEEVPILHRGDSVVSK